jgi:hypothetical protein
MNESKKVGRPSSEINYTEITYENKNYIVAKKMDFHFIFDKDDFEKIKQMSWYKISSGYIASSVIIDGKQRQLLLHRFVMNLLNFPGKGATESVDHINRNPLDNRKKNLRIVSQSEQNINQKKKVRNIVQLPENCGILPDDIPRHIWYIKPNGAHGDRFAIEFKTENLTWKSSSSKKLTLLEKLNQAKEKLEELYIHYPHLNPTTNDNVKYAEILSKSFQDIIECSLPI